MPTAVDELTAILLPVIRHRIDRLGIEESGAYEFYRSRTAKGAVFSDYEIALLQELLRRKLPVSEIHEIGCGYGQFVFLLAWSGFHAIGFEADYRRHRTATALRNALAASDPEATALSRIVLTQFPPIDQEPEGTRTALVISTNFVTKAPLEVQKDVAAALQNYAYALVDIDRFFESHSPDSNVNRQRVLKLFADQGFVASEPFLDLGNSGCYYLFTGRAAKTPYRFREEPSYTKAVTLIHATIEDVLSERILKFGIDESGAKGDYVDFLRRGTLINSHELALADFIETEANGFASFHHIRSGIGTFCFLLALKGFSTTGIEAVDSRHKAAINILQKLSGELSQLEERCQLIHGKLLQEIRKLDVSRSLAILTDFVCDTSPKDIMLQLKRYPAVLIDLQRFHIKRDRRLAVKELRNELVSHGLGEIRATLDLGHSGYYCLFVTPRSARSGLYRRLSFPRWRR